MPLHVVFLVLHRPEQDGVGEVHHLGNAAAGGSEENALRFGGAVDDVFGRAEVFADQLGLVLVEGALQVAGEEAIHDVHARREGKLGDAAQDEGLVGGLLRVLAEEHDPAGVERAIDVVVAAVDVEGVLGERAGADFEHHGGALAGRVVVLLHAVDDALAGGEVDHALAADGVGDGAALGRVFAFGLDGDGVVAEDVQVALGIGLLEELAAFGGRRNGIENAGVGDAGLGVVGDELVSVGGDPDAGIASCFRHVFPPCVLTAYIPRGGSHRCKRFRGEPSERLQRRRNLRLIRYQLAPLAVSGGKCLVCIGSAGRDRAAAPVESLV